MALDLFAPLKKSFNMEEAGEGEALWISPTDLAVFKRHHNDNYVNVPFWVQLKRSLQIGAANPPQ